MKGPACVRQNTMLELRDISKSFGANRVLHSVSLCLEEGRVLGLVGENGAGKSTLMNILGGVVKMDSGSIFLRGKEVHINSPSKAIQNGIAFIHQELNLIDDLRVCENLFIGCFPKTKLHTIDFATMEKRAKQIFREMGVQIEPKQIVSSLDMASRQIVEIAKALLGNAEIIIMDEPTSSLSEKEIELVFSLIRRLKKKGVCFIFISHKLKEVLSICDSYLVLRDGVVAASGSTSGVSAQQIAEMMVGHEVILGEKHRQNSLEEEMLRLESLSAQPYFSNISFSIKKGEIIGFTGLMNDGRSELAKALFGLIKTSGQMYFEGKKVRIASPRAAQKLGIAYVPPNRKENAVIKDMSVLDNFALAKWEERFGVIQFRKTKEKYTLYKKKMLLKADDPQAEITTLSGGNQQKLILARWLNTTPKLLIMDNPTQGVDIAAKEDIYGIIKQQKDLSLIVLSSESQELRQLCDRVYVLYHGQIAACLKEDEISDKNIMLYATGAGGNHD